MWLSPTSLEKLRDLINEETDYRSGAQLVEFFNGLGFEDCHERGFPSRWQYTDDKLQEINGTSQIEDCIKSVFNPAKFIKRFEQLDEHIDDFNQYLVFDKWKIVRNQAEITFQEIDEIEIDDYAEKKTSENEFINSEITDIIVSRLGFEGRVLDVLKYRIREIEICCLKDVPLATILLTGSTLEGIFFGLANQYPKQFNSANSTPKDKNGKPKQFNEWSLSNFIDVGKELNLIEHDMQQFSHTLKDFRNYIHPSLQFKFGFEPRDQTAKICLQILETIIYDLEKNIEKIKE